MDMNRLRLIEIEGGIRQEDDGARVHLSLREGDGLRRALADIVLTAEQFMALARGGTIFANGAVPVEMVGGDKLLDALDQVTSHNGRLTDRAPSEIADDLVNQLSAHERVGLMRAQPLRAALRSNTPRKVATDASR